MPHHRVGSVIRLGRAALMTFLFLPKTASKSGPHLAGFELRVANVFAKCTVLAGSFILAHTVHAQGSVWQVTTNSGIDCQSVDGMQAAECYANTGGPYSSVAPRDFPQGCGLAYPDNPIKNCIWVVYSSPGNARGSFTMRLLGVGSSPKDVGENCLKCGDPITPAISNKIITETDYVAPGPNSIRFVRYYNSASVANSAAYFGPQWSHNFSKSVTVAAKSGPTGATVAVAVTREDGKSFIFTLSGSKWVSDTDVTDTLVPLTSGSTITGWQYTNASDDSLESYDAYGNLSTIAYREGTTLTLDYEPGAVNFPKRLANVTDSYGRNISFGYTNSFITSMIDSDGGSYGYTVSGAFNTLTQVTYPDANYKEYKYNESGFTSVNQPTALTGVIDENRSRYDSTWYDQNRYATKTSLAGGVNQYQLTNALNANGAIQSNSISNPLGATLTDTFTPSVGRNRLKGDTKPAVPGSADAAES